MKAEIDAEGAMGDVEPTIVASCENVEDSDDGELSDGSEEYIAEMIVGHTGKKRTRKYRVQWLGCDEDDTSDEPAQRFGTELPLEILEKYLVSHPSAQIGHSGNTEFLKELPAK